MSPGCSSARRKGRGRTAEERREKCNIIEGLFGSAHFLLFLKDQLDDVMGMPVGKLGHRKPGYMLRTLRSKTCSPLSPRSGWVSESAGLGSKEAEIREVVTVTCWGLAAWSHFDILS